MTGLIDLVIFYLTGFGIDRPGNGFWIDVLCVFTDVLLTRFLCNFIWYPGCGFLDFFFMVHPAHDLIGILSDFQSYRFHD